MGTRDVGLAPDRRKGRGEANNVMVSTVQRPIRILHLEHHPDSAKLVQLKLRVQGVTCDLLRVENRTDFIAALERRGFDLILAQYPLPQFDGPSALEIARERSPELPFIFVTDAFHEESAVKLLRPGATDYVLKPSLSRLAPVVLRAIQEVEERRRRQQADEKLKALHDIHQAMTSTSDLQAILRTMLANLDIFFPQGAAHIVLLDPVTGKIQPSACRNLDEARWRAQFESVEQPMEQRILAAKTRRIIRNIHENTPVLNSEFYCQQGFFSYLGVPLTIRGETIGVFSLFTRQEHDFTDKEIDFAETLAAQAGLAVFNTRLSQENRRLSNDLLSDENQIRKLMTGLFTAQDEEAKRIARVLHDETGQLLTAVYISLDQTAKHLTPAKKVQLAKAKELLDQVEERLRNLSHELYPTILEELGLVASLEYSAGQMSKRSGVRITVDSQLQARLSSLSELTLYRVVQEAINNTVRHARATKVHIQFSEDQNSVYCSIRDDGIGFDVETVSRRVETDRARLGLDAMRERVSAVGGTLQILSAPGLGTDLHIGIPKR
jgi:two-component system sensor histidine kinase UhpB